MQKFRRICPYRFHATARLFFRLSLGFAFVLTAFAFVGDAFALRFPDPLFVYRTVLAAWDTLPAVIAVGVFGGVWLDLAARQYRASP